MKDILLQAFNMLAIGLQQINETEKGSPMPVIKTNYFPYTASKEHGMNAIEYSSQSDAMLNRNGVLQDSVFFKAYNDNGVLATPKPYPFGLTGFDYRIDADGNDSDTIPEWFFEFKVFDKDKDFTGQRLEIDTNPGSTKSMVNLYVDDATGDLIGIVNGQTVSIEGVFNPTGDTLTYQINNDVLQDLTGQTGTVLGQFGWEHWGDNGASSYGQVDLY